MDSLTNRYWKGGRERYTGIRSKLQVSEHYPKDHLNVKVRLQHVGCAPNRHVALVKLFSWAVKGCLVWSSSPSPTIAQHAAQRILCAPLAQVFSMQQGLQLQSSSPHFQAVQGFDLELVGVEHTRIFRVVIGGPEGRSLGSLQEFGIACANKFTAHTAQQA